ncbi:MAG TPA: nitroreductase family protein [Geobacteraceae bacterium]
MDVFQVIRDRRSIRKYKDTPVEREKIEQLLDAARLAPSWKNLQCWRFLVLTGLEKREALLAAFPDDNPGKRAIASAPVVIVVCADPSESGFENGMEYFLADSAIAFGQLCLAAQAVGLGSCWMGLYNEAVVREALGIPAGVRVVGMTPLGYPDQEPKPRPRKELTEIAYFNEWGCSQC